MRGAWLLLRLALGGLVGLPLGLVAFRYADPILVRAAAGAMIFDRRRDCARKSLNSDRGTKGPMHVEPVPDPNPLSAGFFKACEEMGHQTRFVLRGGEALDRCAIYTRVSTDQGLEQDRLANFQHLRSMA